MRSVQCLARAFCVLLAALLATCVLVSADADLACLFYDDFDDEGSGWETGNWRWRGRGYRFGEYAIWENWYDHYQLTWAPYEGLFPEDFVAVVGAYKFSGADDVEYGIAWGRDNENFYYFKVTPDGWYRVGWKRNGDWQDSPVPWTPCGDIYLGAQTNILRIMARGDRATLFINGKERESFELSMAGPWKIGVFGGSAGTARIEVRFTYFAVYDTRRSNKNAWSQRFKL